MPGQTDLERLIVTFEAKTTALTNQLNSLVGTVNKSLTQVEARTNVMTTRVESAFARLGPRLTSTGRVIFGGALTYGIERFVTSIIGAVGKIQDTADAIGISTDALQAWSIQAAQAGVNQDDWTSAIDRFAKSLGQAQLKAGPLRTEFMKLGIDLNGGVEKAFLQFADVIASVGDQGQRTELITRVMGRTSIQLTGFIQQGSSAIRSQTDELKRMGAIIGSDTVAQIDKMGDRWAVVMRLLQATSANALGGFTESFTAIANQLASPEFQSNLKTFGKLIGEASAAIVLAAKYAPEVTGAIVGFKIGKNFGPGGGLIGAGVGAAAGGALAAAQTGKSLEDQIFEAKQAIENIKQFQRDATRDNNPVLLRAELKLDALEQQLADKKNEIEHQDPVTVQARVDIDSKSIEDLTQKLKAAETALKQFVEAGVSPVWDQGKLDELKAKVAELTDQLAHASASRVPKPKINLADQLSSSNLLAQEAQRKRTELEALNAERDRVRAVDDANARILAGTTSVYDAINKKIADNTAAEIAAENERADILNREQEIILQNRRDTFSATEADQTTHDEALINIEKARVSRIGEIEAKGRAESLANARAETEERFKLAEALIQARDATVAAYKGLYSDIAQGTISFYATERDRIEQEGAARDKELDRALAHELANLAERKKTEEAAGGKFKEYEEDVAYAKAKADQERLKSDTETTGKLIQNARAEREERFRIAENLEQLRRETADTQNSLLVELASGTADYFATVRKQINDNRDHQLQALQDEHDHRVAELEQTRIDAQDNAAKLIKVDQDIADADAELEEKKKQINNRSSADLARLLEEETQRKARAIEVSDALRKGLEDVAVSALDGSQSFGKAISSMLKDLALLSLRLFILRPIIEATFGKIGTTGGGILGGITKPGGGLDAVGLVSKAASLFGFADGGVMTPSGPVPLRRYGAGGVANRPQMAIYAEGDDNEAFVPLPDGRRIPVDLRIPPMPKMAAGPSNIVIRNEINLTGANGDATIAKYARQAAIEGAQFAINKIKTNLPGMILKVQRDNL